jgi:hypothetical protein
MWTGPDETQSTFIIQSSTSVNGVDWTSPANPDSAAALALSPRLVEDAHGRVTAVWLAFYGATARLQSSTVTKPACGASPGGGGSLADTGADASVVGTSLAVSAGLLAAGGLALALMRRRNLGGQ